MDRAEQLAAPTRLANCLPAPIDAFAFEESPSSTRGWHQEAAHVLVFSFSLSAWSQLETTHPLGFSKLLFSRGACHHLPVRGGQPTQHLQDALQEAEEVSKLSTGTHWRFGAF